MLKKNVIFVVVLMAVGLAAVSAQEVAASETPSTALFPQYGAGQMFNLTPFAYPESVGGKLGMGFLNLFLGLGSWIAGDWQNGIVITLMQGGGIVLTVMGIMWLAEMTGGLELLLFWWLPVTVGVAGLALWGWGILVGFTAPFTVRAPKTALLNDPRNWTVALVPTSNGNVAGALAFTAHF